MDFTEFFEGTAWQLVQLCFLATLDREAAADAAQEALSRAWRDWDRVGSQDSDPGAWTRTVALNLCRNRRRQLARQAHLLPRAYAVSERDDPLPDVDLERALRRLSTRQREAVVLHYWADLGVKECATAMGVSAGSVKRHLSRAANVWRRCSTQFPRAWRWNRHDRSSSPLASARRGRRQRCRAGEAE